MRKAVIPGEVIVSGEEFLPGEWTEKKGNDILALRYGLAEETNKLVKIIPVSGVYQPRRGNVVIGKVDLITFNGWVINIGTPDNAFLSLTEVPGYVNKNGMDEVLAMGDTVVGKIFEINKRGIDITVKGRGFGRIDSGIIIEVNPNKVPRVIGKEGSMITLIKDETGCNITVGQNGLISVEGANIEKELFAKRAIRFITEHSAVSGLTDEVKKWFDENREKGK